MNDDFMEKYAESLLKEAAVRPEVAKHLVVLLATIHAKLNGAVSPSNVRLQIEKARRDYRSPAAKKE